jgi:arsenate reductase (glutaredoxin)
VLSIPFYWKPTCHTCHGAKKNLEGKHIELEPIDIITDPPSKQVFKALISKYGAKEMIRRNSKDYKELEVGKMKLSDNDLASLLGTHPDLSSRPIVLVDGDVYLTRDPKLFEEKN